MARRALPQRRMGPAPIASFEDLSMEEEPAQPAHLPSIGEDTGEDTMAAPVPAPAPAPPPAAPAPAPAAAPGSTVITPATPSNPRTHTELQAGCLGAGLHTGATPRIDISRASSSSQHDDSSPERELLAGGEPSGAAGERKLLGFMEEGADELKSSTEELHFTEEPGTVEELETRRRAERQRQRKESTQSCHTELAPYEKERKDSACSADFAFLSISGRTSRLSSVGSAASGGSGVSHLSSASRLSGATSRSPSPGRMLLETSFCGTKAASQAAEAALLAKQARRDRGSSSGRRTVERQVALEEHTQSKEDRERHARMIAARRADEVRRAQGKEPKHRPQDREAFEQPQQVQQQPPLLEQPPLQQHPPQQQPSEDVGRRKDRRDRKEARGRTRAKKKSNKEDALVRIIPLHSSDEVDSDAEDEEEGEEAADTVGGSDDSKFNREKARRAFQGLDDKEDLEVQRRRWLETHVSREEDPELVRIIPLRSDSTEQAERVERDRGAERSGERSGERGPSPQQRRLSPVPPRADPPVAPTIFPHIPEDIHLASLIPRANTAAAPSSSSSPQKAIIEVVEERRIPSATVESTSTEAARTPSTVVEPADQNAAVPSPRVPGKLRGPRRKVDPNALVRIIPLHSEDSYEGYGEEDLLPQPSAASEADDSIGVLGGDKAARSTKKYEGVDSIVDEIDMSKWREPSFEETELVRIIPLKVNEEDLRREEEERKLREQQRCFKEHMAQLKQKQHHQPQHTPKRSQHQEEDNELVKIIPLHGSDSDTEKEAERGAKVRRDEDKSPNRTQLPPPPPPPPPQQQQRTRRKLSDTRRSPIVVAEDELVRTIPLHGDDEEVPTERRELRPSSRRTSPRPSTDGDANNNSSNLVRIIPLHGPEEGGRGGTRLEAKPFEPDNLVQMIQLHDSESETELAGYEARVLSSRRSSSRPGSSRSTRSARSARSEHIEPLQIVPLGDPEDETGVSFTRRDLAIQGRLTPQPQHQESAARASAKPAPSLQEKVEPQKPTTPATLDLTGSRQQAATSPRPRRRELDGSRTPSPPPASSRKSSLSSIFFRKATEVVSPESPSSGKRRLTNILKDPRSKSRDRTHGSTVPSPKPSPGPSPTPESSRQLKEADSKDTKETKTKEAKGVFSTLFRKKSIPEPMAGVPAVPGPEVQHPIEEVEFTFKCEAVYQGVPGVPAPPEVPKKTSPSSRSSWPPPPPPLDTNANPSEEDRLSSGSELELPAPAPAGAAEAADEEDHETKGLVLQQDSFEDELPYVPTTLPMERSVAVPLVPAKQRVAEVKTFPIDRPRSTTPINPAALEEYVSPGRDVGPQKLHISLPREDSLPRRSRPQTKPWHDFASQALKPRSRSESQSPPPPLPPRAPSTTPPSTWINFDDLPEKRKAPVRIQTIPSRGSIVTEPPPGRAGAVGGAAVGAGATPPRPGAVPPVGAHAGHSHVHYVDPEDCRCECHESEHQTRQVGQAGQAGQSGHSGAELSAPCRPPKAPPFGMDLDVSSNRSSVASQNEHSSPEIPE